MAFSVAELHKALSAPLDEDLYPLSLLLKQQGLRHRISEQGGEQVLEVLSPEAADAVCQVYAEWRAGKLQIDVQRNDRRPMGPSAATVWFDAPVTLAFIVLSSLTFVATELLDMASIKHAFSFFPYVDHPQSLIILDMGNQYWRLITPIFLHFGWLHIVFNCLWMWELGRHIERAIGHLNMLLLCLGIALVSNVSQYFYGGPSLFGGMSGVVYGLLGFAWVAPFFHSAWDFQPRPAIMVFMVGWLLACLAGLIEALGFGAIANAAHVAGLVSGGLWGAIFGLRARLEASK